MSKSESLSDTIKKGNELHGKIEGKNNCVPSSIAGFMRSKGFDVTAKGTGGEMKNLGGVVEECFKGARVVEGSAVKFGKSRDDAAEMLVKKFGDNASGVCSTTWQKAFGGGGHAFSWKIENGKVSFFDVNARVDDDFISKHYFKAMDTNGSIILARLDNAEIDFENIKKYVKNIGN